MFAYCGNNPVTRIDQTGHDWKDWFYAGLSCLLVGAAILLAVPTGGGSLVLAGVGVSAGSAIALGEAAVITGTVVATGSLVIQNAKSLPTQGDPNSTQKLYDDDGDLKQERHYGSDGKADYDIDYKHGGDNHEFPHKHFWDWTKKPPRQPSVSIETLY